MKRVSVFWWGFFFNEYIMGQFGFIIALLQMNKLLGEEVNLISNYRVCLNHKFCAIIFVRYFWDQKSFKTFFLLVFYMGNSNKSDKQDQLSVFTYLPSIILHIIHLRNPTSKYLHMRYYSDIGTIVSRIFWHLYEHVTNILNMHLSVSMNTRLYMWKICADDIEYLSGACLLVHVECALVAR